MKGVVFNLLEQVVTGAHGADAWDGLLDAAGLDGSYTSLGSYPDEEMVRLVGAASAALGVPGADVLRWFGRAAMGPLAERYPQFFAPHAGARSFILSLNDIIHPEVRKLYAGAACPRFSFEQPSEHALVVGYGSPRRLCHLAVGFAEGAADHWRESLTVEHLSCMADGDTHCRLSLEWAH